MHYHFSVLYKINTDLRLEKNKLFYQDKLINESILEEINNSVSLSYKNTFDGVLEAYKDTNNFILL